MAIYPIPPNIGPTNIGPPLYDPSTMTKVTQVVGIDNWEKLKEYAAMHTPNGLTPAIEAVVINTGYLVRLVNVSGTTYCKTFKDIADLLVAEAAKRRLRDEQPDVPNPYR
jgi:hypothetical protein